MKHAEWRAHLSRQNSKDAAPMQKGRDNVIDLDSRRKKTEVNWTNVALAAVVIGFGIFIFRGK